MSLEGKTLFITGASRGIGLAIAERLVADGAKVVITARNKEALDGAAERLGGAGHAVGVPGRADDPGHQDDMIREAVRNFGRAGPGIRVSGVAPAVVKTEFAKALYEGREDQARQAFPLQRLGEPDDIGGVVAFLLSADAGWLTGQTIVVDGGVSLTAGGE